MVWVFFINSDDIYLYMYHNTYNTYADSDYYLGSRSRSHNFKVIRLCINIKWCYKYINDKVWISLLKAYVNFRFRYKCTMIMKMESQWKYSYYHWGDICLSSAPFAHSPHIVPVFMTSQNSKQTNVVIQCHDIHTLSNSCIYNNTSYLLGIDLETITKGILIVHIIVYNLIEQHGI